MKFYAVLVNGELATVAHLTQMEGEFLKGYALEKGVLDRVVVIETDIVTTLFGAQVEVDNAVDMWR